MVIPEPPVKEPSIREKPIAKPVELPQYCGLIANEKNRTAIIKYGTTVHFLQEGDTLKNIKIKAIKNDTLLVSLGKEKKIILRKNEKMLVQK